MSKVILTKEQANEIEIRKQNFSNESTIKKHLEGWECIRTLNLLTLDELIRALYIGYEVIEEFKKGDWVVRKQDNEIGVVVEDITNMLHVTTGGEGFVLYEKVFRHATPEEIAKEKQRRFWHENGREVWELKRDDIIRHKVNYDFDEIIEINREGDIFLLDDIYPRSIGYIKENYKVACFAHDRKDLKND